MRVFLLFYFIIVSLRKIGNPLIPRSALIRFHLTALHVWNQEAVILFFDSQKVPFSWTRVFGHTIDARLSILGYYSSHQSCGTNSKDRGSPEAGDDVWNPQHG